MKTIYFIYSEGECGEVNGVFDAEENILGYWSCNDATWRNEYFSGFMAKLKIKCVEDMPDKLQQHLEKKLIAHMKKEGW